MTAPRGDSAADLFNRFAFHPATEITGPLHNEVRDRIHALASILLDLIPPGREAALVVTKLEETMFWANAAIARHTTDVT